MLSIVTLNVVAPPKDMISLCIKALDNFNQKVYFDSVQNNFS
jgi:hypothetical protein